MSQKISCAVLFHNVRSAHNVGALLRTADGAGISKVYLTGYTPSPIDRFGRSIQAITKTALGAEKTVSWEHEKNPYRVIHRLRTQGWIVVGVEQDARAKDYRAFKFTKSALFIFGSEVRGLSKALREKCDALIEIPMRGKKESLNVSVAAGIILYQVCK